MALKQRDIPFVVSAIDMLLRAIVVSDNSAVNNNLQKARGIIDNLLKQGRTMQEKKEG